MYDSEESKIDAMLRKIEEQRGAGGAEGYTLYGFSDAHLHNVHLFIRSFIGKGAGARAPLPVLSAENTVLRAEPNQPAVAELAERLAKVEDRQAALDAMFTKGPNRLNRRQERLDDRIDTSEKQTREALVKVNERIDKVAEIIGERVSGLVVQIDALVGLHANLEHLDPATVTVQDVLRTLRVARMSAPDFPTGGASTAEAAADAVLPVPQRGDRVRLEGARSVVGSAIADGWYDVLGFAGAPDNPQFQIRVRDADLGMQGIDTPAYSPWLFCGQPSLKEVRHADHT